MRLKRHCNTVDFDRDLPTTVEDVNALRVAKERGLVQEVDYLLFLASFGELSLEERRARPCPKGVPPFELP